MTSGILGAFKWIEAVSKDDTGVIGAVRKLRGHLIELRAVNVSWDSGLLEPSDEEKRRGWRFEQGRAVSPVIDDGVIDAWPWCDGGWEEWYFFSTVPSNLNLSAYCNRGGLSIGDWASLVDLPDGPTCKSNSIRRGQSWCLAKGRDCWRSARMLSCSTTSGRFLRRFEA